MENLYDTTLTKRIVDLIRKDQLNEACHQLLDSSYVQKNRNETYFLIARLKMRAKEFDDALKYFDEIEGVIRETFKYWYLRGRCEYVLGYFEVARKSLMIAADFHPLPPRIEALLAISAYRTGKFQQAHNIFVKIGSYINEFQYVRGIANFAAALVNEEEINQDPMDNWIEDTIVRGILLCRQNEQEEEAEFLLDLILSAPQSAWGRTYFCKAGSKLKFAPNGASVHKILRPYIKNKTISIDRAKYSPFFYTIIANVLNSVGLFAYAAKIYFRLMEAKQLDLVNLRIASTCFFKTKQYQLSIKAYAKVVEIEPNDNSAYFGLAKAYDKLGNTEHAIQCANFHLNIVPRDDSAILWLANIAIDNSDEKYAEKQLVKAQKINPKSKKAYHLSIAFADKFGRGILPRSTLADYSYIDWNRISIPAEFQLAYDNREITKLERSPIEVLKTLSTVVGALIIREMTTRFGRNGLGYLWTVIQQLVFVSVFAVLFELKGRNLPYGVSILAFLITGINAFYIFRNTIGQMKNALKKNRSLLHFRQVSPLSIYASRAILETLTGVFIFSVLVAASIVLGEEINMSSLLQVLSVLCLLGLFGSCYGLFIATISTFMPSIGSFENSFGRVLFFTSGCFFYANELPPEIRNILLWNPLLHLIELLRDGFFVTYTAQYASLEYVMWWTIGFLFFALVLERVGRNRMLST